MSTELAITTTLNEAIPTAAPEYKSMLTNIAEKMPAVTQATSNFHKSHSQFMGVTLDVTAITPIRSIKHTLAEIDKTRSALQEAYINLRKKEVKLKKKQLVEQPRMKLKKLIKTLTSYVSLTSFTSG